MGLLVPLELGLEVRAWPVLGGLCALRFVLCAVASVAWIWLALQVGM